MPTINNLQCTSTIHPLCSTLALSNVVSFLSSHGPILAFQQAAVHPSSASYSITTHIDHRTCTSYYALFENWEAVTQTAVARPYRDSAPILPHEHSVTPNHLVSLHRLIERSDRVQRSKTLSRGLGMYCQEANGKRCYLNPGRQSVHVQSRI